MHSGHLVLLVLSFVLAALAALGVPSGRLNLCAAAFACYVASLLI